MVDFIERDSLLDDLKEKMGCASVSAFRNINKNIENNLDYVLLGFNANDYDVKQWESLTHYIFPNAQIDVVADSTQLRNSLILAIYEYRKLKEQIERLNVH